jgi:hypothetical protein
LGLRDGNPSNFIFLKKSSSAFISTGLGFRTVHESGNRAAFSQKSDVTVRAWRSIPRTPIMTPACQAWLRAREVLAGEDAVKGAGEKYLPRLESQSDDEYKSYKARAAGSMVDRTGHPSYMHTTNSRTGPSAVENSLVLNGAATSQSGADPLSWSRGVVHPGHCPAKKKGVLETKDALDKQPKPNYG